MSRVCKACTREHRGLAERVRMVTSKVSCFVPAAGADPRPKPALLQHQHQLQEERAGGTDAHEPAEEDVDAGPCRRVRIYAYIDTMSCPMLR